MNLKDITLVVTGASGMGYFKHLLAQLVPLKVRVHIVFSKAALVVCAQESDLIIPGKAKLQQRYLTDYFSAEDDQIICYDREDWFSPIASGSAAPRTMVICPCSTGTLSAVAHGASNNLIERAADVVLKERGQLILVPRESPYNQIHLENMLKLTQMGATIVPASPGFYHHPQSIDDLYNFIAGRILDLLGLEQTVMPRWGYQLS